MGAVDYWSQRARSLSHPLLKARYADLAWDMAQVIGQKKRDPEDARVAIDANLASIAVRDEPHDQFVAAIRALDLACLLSDTARVDAARAALLELHRAANKAGSHQWWFAIDRLIDDKKSGITDAERAELVADLEGLIVRYADEANPGWHDPNAARDAADRLIKHYEKQQRSSDIKRLRARIARAFEHAASLADAMLAAAFLQTAMDSYRQAGMPDDSSRIRILMQQKIGEANAAMVPVSTEMKITFDDMEKFLDAVIVDDLSTSLVRIAREFLLRRNRLEQAVKDGAEKAPLMAHITQHVMADDHVVAKIGSVEEDPFGRLFHEAKFRFGFSAPWLQQAFLRLLEKHDIPPECIVGWANRHGLFEDMALLLEGVRAWFQGDYAKTTHILIPQIEVALRSIAAEVGLPVTKAHPKIQGTSVAIGMGDILYTAKVTDVLGPDITLHMQALFADPRGLNLRNEMAHGLLGATAFDGHTARLLIQFLLILGIWKELVKRPQAKPPAT